ncbi:MAG: hypothetical protein II943_00815 [Victivallales bacterium]|nr:hypothetical protein [Victivallales bacterium]
MKQNTTAQKNLAAAIAKRAAEGKPLPKVGQGAFYCSGSDRYGYQIMAVADNLAWFVYGSTDYTGKVRNNGMAKLCTTKNSKAFGHYIACRYTALVNCDTDLADYWTNPDKWEPRTSWNSCGLRYYNIIGLTGTDGEEPTYLDPSF